MILFELTNTEQHPVYQEFEIANVARQYDFLRSIVVAAIKIDRPHLSANLINALNYQAIACLHTNAGEYRPCPVSVGSYNPPQHFRVHALMDDFINMVNRSWDKADSVQLAAFVLWRLNHIHPFINGNGRTARAAAYFVLCVKSGGWLPGKVILPELIVKARQEYVEALRLVDESVNRGETDLTSLHVLLSRLLTEQLASAQPSA